MDPVGFEPAIPVSERPLTYALDRMASGTGTRYTEGDEIKVDKMCGALTCLVKVKVKCTLVQALRLCTGRTAHRGCRGIVLIFHDHGARKGVRGQRHAPAALYPRERPGTHCTGGWVGPTAGLDRCGKSRHYRNATPGPSSP